MIQNTTKYLLANGLKVIFQQNKSADVAAIQVWVNIGSRDELRGNKAKFKDEGGLAHIQEHMLFQGTNSYPGQGEIANLIEANGGDFNAWTNYDETVYHVTMPAKNTELALKILASMVSEATSLPDRLTKELEVVMEEFRRCNDNPHIVLQEELFKKAYKTHPYQHPIIGYENTIKAIDQKTVLNFFNKYYKPSNMTVVVVGNIDEKKFKKWIDQSFAKFPKKTKTENIIPQEPKQKEARIFIMKRNFAGTYLSLGHHITNFTDKRTPAVDILYNVLGHGADSRLQKRLLEKKKLVHAIQSSAYTPKDPGFGFIDADLDSKNLKEAIFEIGQEIQNLQTENISTEELEKAKLQLESHFIYGQETFEGIARTLGQFELLGNGYDDIPNYINRIKAVTPDDVKKVAQEFLNFENTNLGVLIPEKGQPERIILAGKIKISEKDLVESLKEGYRKKKVVIRKKSTDKLKHILSNGIRLVLQKTNAVNSVSFTFAILGGLLSENLKTNGISNFTAAMLTRGTKKLNQEEFASSIESMASFLEGYNSANSFGLWGKSLSQNLFKTLELACDSLTIPSFDRQEIEKMQSIIIDEIKRELDNPIQKSIELFHELLYDKHPYSLKSIGKIENIKNFQQKQLLKYLQSVLLPKNMVISIVGDINIDSVIQFFERNLGQIKAEKSSCPKSKLAKFNFEKINYGNKSKHKSIKIDKQQSNIVLGFKGISIDSKEIFALDVLKKVLAGMGGRLFINLRDKQGLAYSITAFQKPGFKCDGHFAAYLGCAPEKQNYAIEELRRELKHIKEEKISTKELSDAKNFLIGYHAVARQSNAAKATNMCSYELYGLSYDYDEKICENINKVTKEDVLKIANKIINFDREILAIVGPN